MYLSSEGISLIKHVASWSSSWLRKSQLSYSFKNKYLLVHALDETAFEDVDYAIFLTEAAISKQYIPIALSKNVVVIDNSSYFRLEDNVKLIAYGVTEHLLKKDDMLISNPNCCTI